MTDWLAYDGLIDSDFTPKQVLVRLGVAAIYGFGVALVFRTSHGRRKQDAGVLTSTLVLLSILIAMVSMVIGDSVARAFSLVGALSIVRFRTVVQDTRDTAFVIFAVVVGMAAGAGLPWVPLIGIPLVGVIASLMSLRTEPAERTPTQRHTLVLRVTQFEKPLELFEPILSAYATNWRVAGVQ
ncbi:MAG: DUF4956 domain-containing protein, partial [Planctomycetales bacterium]|nr:DUF4956 domain-containing protein [Planctomycetales bacterium]